MKIQIGETYPCEDTDKQVKIVSDLQSHGIKFHFRYVGALFLGDKFIGTDLFNEQGETGTENENWNIKLPISKFSVGNYDTKTYGRKGVVTTISPHESSTHRLIGFVIDDEKRMVPTMWTFEGKNVSTSLLDLVGYE